MVIRNSIYIENPKALEEYINYVDKMLLMRSDKNFQEYIKDKCFKTLQKIVDNTLIGGTTNDDAIGLYKSSNHIQEIENGFIIYNDAKIEANTKDASNYPNGQFSIALAFEYGVGIIGQNTPNNDNAWQYNINNYNFGWYFKDKDGKYHQTGGYTGFGIYRQTANEIEKNIQKWVKDYFEDKK